MTLLEPVDAPCGLCGVVAHGSVLASSNTMGPPDLDSRPAEMLRSALPFGIWSCAHCGYAANDAEAFSDLRDDMRADVAALVTSDGYRRIRLDETMPELARSFLQRAAIDDLIDEPGSATLNGIRAAWCCDDASSAGEDGAREAGWRCRDAALASAASVAAGEGELLSEGDAAYEALVLADTERKARRFREALDRCAAWVESGTDPAVLPLYRFVADRAWHEDDRTYTLADAWDADLRGDPSARRVPPQPTLVGSVLWSLEDGPEGPLELRLAAGGTTFMVVVEAAGAERQMSLAEAALIVLHEDEDGVDGLLQVVETTLELLAGQWPPSTGLRAELEVAERRLRDIDDRDPLSSRVVPLAASSGTVVHTFETATDRIELRRTPDGSVWVAVDDDGDARQVSVFEAASTAAEPDAWRFHDVLGATQTELEFYDRGHDGPTRYDRPPDTDIANVVLLWEEWQAALDAIRDAGAAEPVAASALRDLLDEARNEGSDVRVRVRGHRPGADEQVDSVSAAVQLAVHDRPDDTVMVVDAGIGAYVQVMSRRDRPTTYVEAADPGHHGEAPLDESAREALHALGWRDPKSTPVPYEDAAYPEHWDGGNFAQEFPRSEASNAIAEVLVETLRRGYGVAADADLELRIFDAR